MMLTLQGRRNERIGDPHVGLCRPLLPSLGTGGTVIHGQSRLYTRYE